MSTDKYSHIEDFSDLEIPQNMDEVLKTANEFNIDISNVNIQLKIDKELLNVELGFTGGAFENNEVDLYPLAFADKETLARTLFHETYHNNQYALLGYENVINEYVMYEKITRNAEKSWWENKEWTK